MWLDRLSGQSTPSRDYSPAPRRSAHLGSHLRPGQNGLANRSSISLDLSANTSTTSLTAPNRLNGSSLRYEQRPAPDVPDPIEVLKSILGLSREGESESRQPSIDGDDVETNTRLAAEIDFQGQSLEEYLNATNDDQAADLISSKGDNADLERKKYEDFQLSVSECDGVLASVEAHLTRFQADLGQVSLEIENLQERSIQINAKLENRRNVERLLGPAVEEVTLSPMTVKAISEGPVDEIFIQALRDVETRSAAIESKISETEPAKAVEDLRPLITDLKAKAVERIRDFIVAQIKALRSPNINAQILQQQTLMKYKELYSFLVRNHAVLADEIGQAYINTMKWYYSSNFTKYLQSLDKLQLHELDQQDILGADARTSTRNVLASSKPPPPPHDVFNIGRRADLLKAMNEPAISSYLAEESKIRHYLEVPFRNFNQALIDNVSTEYAISSELFAANGFHNVSRKVSEIFESTFVLGHNLTKKLVETTTDCLGVLLCVRLNQHFAFELQRRKVPVADSYINYINILLWPRFQRIMDIHCESLKKLSSSTTSRGANAAFSLVGGTDSSKSSVAPHPITQRFGQFLQGILVLSAESGDDEPVSHSLGRLRSEYEALMGKLAKSGAGGDLSRRNKFLGNNYSLVLTIVSDCQGKLAEDIKEHFELLLRDARGR